VGHPGFTNTLQETDEHSTGKDGKLALARLPMSDQGEFALI